jgi:hypothetical protein
MAKEVITNDYALYNGDCIEVMRAMPDESIGMSVYSPPFCGLYNYSSDERDLSNCRTYSEFFNHYSYVVEQIARITPSGRISAVHCMDIPGKGNGETARMGSGANTGTGLIDFPGDIIRLHERHGFEFSARRAIWKEPLGVRLRTMAKGLAHAQICEDSTLCDVASADYLLTFRKRGENKVPVTHPTGLHRYAGERIMPHELERYRGWTGKQTENRFSHWIWRQYASSFWDDIRIERTLPYRDTKGQDDEKHVHPLQLDVIERACVLWTNPREIVFTPFMGVGSEVYGAVLNGRIGVGAELKEAYFRQAVLNMTQVGEAIEQELFQSDQTSAGGEM